MPSHRVQNYHEEMNDRCLEGNLDLLEEMREEADGSATTYRRRTKQYFNKVKAWLVRVGDLVLREMGRSTKRQEERKLGPRWEGPYVIVTSNKPDSYQLEDMNGRSLTHPCNA